MNQGNREAGRTGTRRVILLSILCSVLCLAYFYMLDRTFFSSRYFSPIFQLLLTGYDAQVAWLMVAVCLLGRSVESAGRSIEIGGFSRRPPDRIRRWQASVPVVLGAIFVCHEYPLCMDEYAAVFQSKIFASGHLFAELPPSAVKWLIFPGFNGSFLVASQETGRAVEGYWPGYALLLAPFEFLNMPWLCNALLAGLAIYLIYRITLDITGDRRAAGWAMLFGIASGAFWANAISLYSMQAHLTANLLFAWLLLQPTRGRCFAAGVVGSFALILHNPFPHALFALPWIVALVLRADTRRVSAPADSWLLADYVRCGIGMVHVPQLHRDRSLTALKPP